MTVIESRSAPPVDGIERQIAALTDRLLAHYCEVRGLDRDAVIASVERVRGEFAGARVRAYLPILIERGVRAELGT